MIPWLIIAYAMGIASGFALFVGYVILRTHGD